MHARVWLLPLALILAPADAAGTVCAIPPPCMLLGPDKVFFVGEVASEPVAVRPPVGDFAARYLHRLRVREALAGFSAKPTELEALLAGRFTPGEVLLVEAVRNPAGPLETRICTLTGPAGDKRFVGPMIAFLRERKHRSPYGSIHVSVTERATGRSSQSGVRVVVIGPVKREAVTRMGQADIRHLPPGRYSIHASSRGYRPADGPLPTVVVPAHGCPAAHVQIDPR